MATGKVVNLWACIKWPQLARLLNVFSHLLFLLSCHYVPTLIYCPILCSVVLPKGRSSVLWNKAHRLWCLNFMKNISYSENTFPSFLDLSFWLQGAGTTWRSFSRPWIEGQYIQPACQYLPDVLWLPVHCKFQFGRTHSYSLGKHPFTVNCAAGKSFNIE